MFAIDPKRWEPSSCRWAASDGLSHNRSPHSGRRGQIVLSVHLAGRSRRLIDPAMGGRPREGAMSG